MNLNFYSPNHAGSLENLQNALQEQITKLDQIRSMDLANYNKPSNNVNNVNQLNPQRYYLDCGNKQDWEEFLKINYNITERQIFEDYRLFLQAKAEINEDRNKEKLEDMKQKLASPKNVDNRIKEEFSPNNISNQQMYNIHQSLPINQQVDIKNMEKSNASNTTINSNQNVVSNNAYKLEKGTNSNENRGIKHVR